MLTRDMRLDMAPNFIAFPSMSKSVKPIRIPIPSPAITDPTMRNKNTHKMIKMIRFIFSVDRGGQAPSLRVSD